MSQYPFDHVLTGRPVSDVNTLFLQVVVTKF